ncbi:hypothetical protein DFP72DRAFT_750136, partial [Ephemerocybe angulata]
GLVPLHIGMPVILRQRNISTDLGITNGAQGVVKKIVTGRLPDSEHEYAKAVIIHFPGSKVHLPDLPHGYFPVEPISWSFTTVLPKTKASDARKLRIRRYQLPIQPAFAVTGHSAQGKTL